MATDMDGQHIDVGDWVSAAFREGNVANQRLGVVQNLGFDYEPNVTRLPETEKVPVAWVTWTTTTGTYLPKRPTKVSAAKLLVVGNVRR